MTTLSQPRIFGELEPGKRFIGFPLDGDNSGHGGFQGGHVLFIKIAPTERGNARAVTSGATSHIPDGMAVIEVL